MNKLIEAQMTDAKKKLVCDENKCEILKGERCFFSEDGSKVWCEVCYEQAVREIDWEQLEGLREKVIERINDRRRELLPDPEINIGEVRVCFSIGHYNAYREIFYSGEASGSYFEISITDPSTWERRTMRRGVKKWKDIDDLEKKIMKKIDDIIYKMEKIIDDEKEDIDKKMKQLEKERKKSNMFNDVIKRIESLGFKGEEGYSNSFCVERKKVKFDVCLGYYDESKVHVEIDFEVNPKDVEKLKEVIDLIETFSVKYEY